MIDGTMSSRRRAIFLVVIVTTSVLFLLFAHHNSNNKIVSKENAKKSQKGEERLEEEKPATVAPVQTSDLCEDNIKSERQKPLIFVEGFPRSGTTLMRTMLDAHLDIRCGPETRIIPVFLDKVADYLAAPNFQATGLVNALVESAADFILNIIKNNGPTAKYLCNKDPFTCGNIRILRVMFPNSKHIFMVRDPRAVVHSLKERKVTFAIIDTSDSRESLKYWNHVYENTYQQCAETNQCMLVHYEELVLQPVRTTKSIFNFLQIPWSEDVLYHEKHLNRTVVVKTEPSTDQIEQPLYLDALTSWFGKLPLKLLLEVPKLAPMMQVLGYNPYDFQPQYGEPDDFVLKRGIWARTED